MGKWRKKNNRIFIVEGDGSTQSATCSLIEGTVVREPFKQKVVCSNPTSEF